MRIRVQGGTDAGSRAVREYEPWECRCVIWIGTPPPIDVPRRQPEHLYSCPDCGARNPYRGGCANNRPEGGKP